MSPVIIIAAISQILTMSGIVSIRMFLPVFLYCLIMRLALAFPQYVPDLIIRFAEKTPSWQLSWPFLTVFGILAVAELAAVRNAEIKRFLVHDFDRYAKPIMSILIAIGIVTNVQSMGTQELLNGAAASVQADFFSFATVTTVVAALVSWSITEICCRIRAAILEKLDMIAPDNTLYMQSITNGTGELILIGGFLLMIFLPILSLILVLIGFALGILFKQIWKWFEARHTHRCAACRDSLRNDGALFAWQRTDPEPGLPAWSLRPHEGVARQLVLRLKYDAEARAARLLAGLLLPLPEDFSLPPGTVVT